MRGKHSFTRLLLFVTVCGLFALTGAAVAMADDSPVVSDHVLAGLITPTGLDIYVTGEPGYEPGMWHHITPAEYAEITKTGNSWNEITWYVGQLPGTIHVDEASASEPIATQAPTESTAAADTNTWDHVLAGLLTTGAIYVAGEPGYEPGLWHHITPEQLQAISQTGAGIFDVVWYGDSLPGSICTECP
jgi:hypothetical protein